MRCLHLLVGLAVVLTYSAKAEAGGSYGSYGSYGSSGGSSGGLVHGSSGGGLLSGLRRSHCCSSFGIIGRLFRWCLRCPLRRLFGRIIRRRLFGWIIWRFFRWRDQSLESPSPCSGDPRAVAGGYTASYSSGGASSGGSSGGYYRAASVSVAPVSHGSSGGYSSHVSYAAPVSYSAPITRSPVVRSSYPVVQSSYPVQGYSSSSYAASPYGTVQPTASGVVQSDPAPMGGSVIDGAIIDHNASYESQKPALDDDAALLTVAVPVESARVTVNGHETTSDGMVRQFMSRGLKEGYLYTYEVVVSYQLSGREMTDTKTIKLRPGDMERMVFHQSEDVSSESNDQSDSQGNETQVSAPAVEQRPETVVKIHVPEDASVILAGNPTHGVGPTRTFRTTQLAAGQSWENYTVVVTTRSQRKECSPATHD